MSRSPRPVVSHPSGPGALPASRANRFLLPREHGAWGMVSLPFLAGAIVAGGWANWRTLAALLAVFSVFLLRVPLLVLMRARAAANKYGEITAGKGASGANRLEIEHARFSLGLYALVAAMAGLYLAVSLPLALLLPLGGGAALLTLASLFFTVRNYQRHPALQILSVFALTSSTLVAYLSARGQLEAPAFWIWMLSAAHGSASVLVVRARLESLVANRKPGAASRNLWRHALEAQAGLWLLLGLFGAFGRPWLIIPFLPPMALHTWELWRLRSGRAAPIPLHRVGWMQLGASLAFSVLLIAVLR